MLGVEFPAGAHAEHVHIIFLVLHPVLDLAQFLGVLLTQLLGALGTGLPTYVLGAGNANLRVFESERRVGNAFFEKDLAITGRLCGEH